MTPGEDSDSGFVLVEVLVAAAILAAVGTAAYALAWEVLQRNERELDVSLAMTNLETRAYELQVVGWQMMDRLPTLSDGVYDYRQDRLETAEPIGLTGLTTVRIDARRANGTLQRSVETFVSARGIGQRE